MHQSGNAQAAKYTRTRHPLQLVFTADIGIKSAASRAEYYIKQLPKNKERIFLINRFINAPAVLGLSIPALLCED